MKFSKSVSSAILLFASFCTVLQPTLALADATFKLRIMIDPAQLNPTVTTVDFGMAPVGTLQQATTIFTNPTGALSVYDTATSSVELVFDGAGLAVSSFGLSSTSVAFGNVATGAKPQQSILVTNSGSLTLTAPVSVRLPALATAQRIPAQPLWHPVPAVPSP